MVSKQQQKYVTSLHNKKYRTEFKEFLVEGEKAILELMDSDFEIKYLFGTPNLKSKITKKLDKFIDASETEIQNLTTLKTNNAGLAVVIQKNLDDLQLQNTQGTIVLDNIQDPGNLGTIIRLADWYNIKNIVCSLNTVEFYNPKVISATMGSFTRVNLFYKDLDEFLEPRKARTYGAFLDAQNVYDTNFEEDFVLVIGSESHGISKTVAENIQHKITIPRRGHAESLNAGIATGIILDNIFRNK